MLFEILFKYLQLTELLLHLPVLRLQCLVRHMHESDSQIVLLTYDEPALLSAIPEVAVGSL